MTDTTTVTIEGILPDGTAAVNQRVTASLIHGGAGASVDGEAVVIASKTVKLDADGGSVDLIPNSLIEPAGTFYALVVDNSSPTVTRCIEVPEGGPVSWADPGIQVEAPVPPVSVPAASSGDPLQVLRVKADGSGYELAELEGLDDRPVLESADWWIEAGRRVGALADRSPTGAHFPMRQIPAVRSGKYLALLTDGHTHRPQIPDDTHLAFPDGAIFMWDARMGLVDGFEEWDGYGVSDAMAHQSEGELDAIEVGEHANEARTVIRGFADDTVAGADPEDGDTQTYSDRIPARELGTARAVKVTWSGGVRYYDYFIADDDADDLVVAGARQENWRQHGAQKSRTAGPGFYDSGLPWYLGDRMMLMAWLQVWDVDTGDLAIDFDPAEVDASGWTDQVGNPWDSPNPWSPIVTDLDPADEILASYATPDLEAAVPGAGSWTFAHYGRFPTGLPVNIAGTLTAPDSPGWALLNHPVDGLCAQIGDGDTTVLAELGITDTDVHLTVVRVDRSAGTVDISVDGVPVHSGAVGFGEILTDPTTVLAAGFSYRDVAVWNRALTDDDLAALADEVAAPDGASDPNGTAAALVAAVEVEAGGTVDVVSNVASGRILGRTTAGSGDSEELTPAAVRTLLDVYDTAAVDTGLAGKVPTSRTLAGLDLSANRSASDLRTALSLVVGTNVQAWDPDLDTIAGLSPSDDDFLQRKSGAWTNRTPAQVRSDLGGLQLISRKTLSSSSSLESFTIPSGIRHGRLTIGGFNTSAAGATLGLRHRFNGDTSSAYSTNAVALTTYSEAARLSGSLTNTDRSSFVVYEWWYVPGKWLTGYAVSVQVGSNTSTSATPSLSGFSWTGATSTAPTSIDLYFGTGGFASGCEFSFKGAP